MKNIILLFIVAFGFISCSDDDNVLPQLPEETIKKLDKVDHVYHDSFFGDITSDEVFEYEGEKLIKLIHSGTGIGSLNVSLTFTYDSEGNVINTIADDGNSNNETQFIYTDGLITSMVDYNNSITTFSYNNSGQLINTTNATQTVDYVYNSDGNVSEETQNESGVVRIITYEYDTKKNPRYYSFGSGLNFSSVVPIASNNITKLTISGSSNSMNNYEYTYDSEDYPLVKMGYIEGSTNLVSEETYTYL